MNLEQILHNVNYATILSYAIWRRELDSREIT